ncbi:MAG: hypothetical protein LBR79_00070 [Oscillospiraceae bacterium]|jgi:hypothetical protein|nr:hypothetical protein [Oscillospiraceae bacterium]
MLLKNRNRICSVLLACISAVVLFTPVAKADKFSCTQYANGQPKVFDFDFNKPKPEMAAALRRDCAELVQRFGQTFQVVSLQNASPLMRANMESLGMSHTFAVLYFIANEDAVRASIVILGTLLRLEGESTMAIETKLKTFFDYSMRSGYNAIRLYRMIVDILHDLYGDEVFVQFRGWGQPEVVVGIDRTLYTHQREYVFHNGCKIFIASDLLQGLGLGNFVVVWQTRIENNIFFH